VEEGASTVAEYAYNGLGQRVTKTLDGMTTVFHYDHSGKLIAESLPDGIITAEYLYMGKIRIAHVDVITGTIYYYLNDRLGTPQLMTDDAGTIVWEASYKPFGETTINPRSSVVNNFRFPGQYYDQETGLHYNYFRYYDPRTGRYVRPDPLNLAQIQIARQTSSNALERFLVVESGGDVFFAVEQNNLSVFLNSYLLSQYSSFNPQTLAFYPYVLNNPLALTDSLGLWAISIAFYKGFGGGFVFGKNPGGDFFLSFRYGYGIGGGVSFDPRGTSPGWDPCEQHGLVNLGLGAYGGASMGFGPAFLGLSANAGVNFENPGGAYPHYGAGVHYGLNWGWSLRAGTAVGGEITFY